MVEVVMSLKSDIYPNLLMISPTRRWLDCRCWNFRVVELLGNSHFVRSPTQVAKKRTWWCVIIIGTNKRLKHQTIFFSLYVNKQFNKWTHTCVYNNIQHCEGYAISDQYLTHLKVILNIEYIYVYIYICWSSNHPLNFRIQPRFRWTTRS